MARIAPWRLTWSHRATHLCNLGYTGAFLVHLFNKGGWLGQGPGQKNFVDNLFSVPPSSTKSCPEQVPLLCYDSAQHTPPRQSCCSSPMFPCLPGHGLESFVAGRAGTGSQANDLKQGKLTLWHRSTHFKACSCKTHTVL